MPTTRFPTAPARPPVGVGPQFGFAPIAGPPPPAVPPPPWPPVGSAGPPEPVDPHDGADTADHARAGAIWVTATGALLLLAAAAVFVAVQWGALAPEVKLGIVMAASGGFLVAGKALRSLLPATSTVLYHLGAFLLPVVVAAIAIDRGADLAGLLLAEGLTAAVVFPVLNRTERSRPLRWAAIAGVAVTAIGLGGTTGLPAAVLLASAALAAEVARSWAASGRGSRSAPSDAAIVAWAAVAGYAPAISLAATLGAARPALLDDLGLVTPHASWSGAVAGVLAAAVLARLAHRRRDLVLVVVGAGALAVGAAASIMQVQPTAGSVWPGAAAAFLLAELAAHRLRHDPFWGRPLRSLAVAAEITAGLCIAGLAVTAAEWGARGYRPDALTRPGAAIAALVAGVAWLVGDQRRRVGSGVPASVAILVGSGWAGAAPAIATTAIAGTVWATWSPTPVSVACAAVAVLAVASGRPLAHVTAAVTALAAPAVAFPDATLAFGLGVVASATLAGAARLRLATRVPWAQEATGSLALLALVPLAIGAGALVADGWRVAPVLVVTAMLAWLTATSLDDVAEEVDAGVHRFGAPTTLHAGAAAPSAPYPAIALTWIGRLGAVLTIGAAHALGSTGLVALGASLTVVILADALRTRRPELVYLAAVTVPVSATAGGIVAGLSPAASGVVVAGCAAGTALAALLVTRPWQAPVGSVVLASALVAISLSSARPDTLGSVLLVIGGVVTAAGLARRMGAIGFTGAVAMTSGVWLHLDHATISASDAFAAPVAALLLVAGVISRRRADVHVSSWVAYGPAILIIGITALLERIDGGPGLHAVIAGVVAVTALVVGASRRLAAPLMLGTVLVVATTWHELLAVEVDAPISFWLAAGGALLVGAGVALERHDTGPLETGRRLVDTIHERYS